MSVIHCNLEKNLFPTERRIDIISPSFHMFEQSRISNLKHRNVRYWLRQCSLRNILYIFKKLTEQIMSYIYIYYGHVMLYKVILITQYTRYIPMQAFQDTATFSNSLLMPCTPLLVAIMNKCRFTVHMKLWGSH